MSVFRLREVAETDGAVQVTVRVYVGPDEDHLTYAGTLTVRNTAADPEFAELEARLHSQE